MPTTLGTRLSQTLDELRVLLREYALLPEAEARSVRHELYIKHGDVGKPIVKAFADVIAAEEKQC